MKAALKPILSLRYVLILAASLLAGQWVLGAAKDNAVYLAFSSDIHYGQSGNYTVKAWLNWLQTKVKKIDAIGFCGDIGNNDIGGADAYWQTVGDAFDLTDKLWKSGFIAHEPVYVYGNHDWNEGKLPAYQDNRASLRFRGQGEAVRTDKYAIYRFGAHSASPPAIYMERDISDLQAYLDQAPNNIPIIILTHYPLYDYSTIKTENADKVIDVLNRKPNVICFWGHYHAVSGNFDNILVSGDSLPINGRNRAINFTYLQAGCLNFNGTNKRGTIMRIAGSQVTMTRYDTSGSTIDERTITLAALP